MRAFSSTRSRRDLGVSATFGEIGARSTPIGEKLRFRAVSGAISERRFDRIPPNFGRFWSKSPSKFGIEEGSLGPEKHFDSNFPLP